jgi:hypothetical protein
MSSVGCFGQCLRGRNRKNPWFCTDIAQRDVIPINSGTLHRHVGFIFPRTVYTEPRHKLGLFYGIDSFTAQFSNLKQLGYVLLIDRHSV